MRRVAATVLAVALALTACTDGAPGDGPDQPGGSGPDALGAPLLLPDDLVLAASLTGFDGCAAFLAHMQEHALELVTPWGLGWYGGGFRGGVDMPTADVAEADDGSVAPAPAAPVEGEDFSGTNVQEVGVDEPDIVKTDGRVMYVVTGGRIVVLDVTGDEPVELASVPMRDAWDAQLLLDGDRLLVTSSAYAVIPFAGERIASDLAWPGGGWGGTTTITLLDVSDPSAPEAIERLTVDGATLSARLVDGVARIVVRTEQGNLPWVHPEGSGLRAERAALEANRGLIRRSTAEDWIPYFVHETAGGRETEGSLLACNRIATPREFAGLGVLSVLTVDLARGGLSPGREALGVLAGGETIYASRGTLYVATTRWVDPGVLDDAVVPEPASDRVTTQIHAFDISRPRDVDYLGSGTVPGTLLSQWAMSEHEGVLRVASTVGDTWGWGRGAPSESAVTTLAHRGDELVQLGQVTGLGVTERIYAVRFIGDVGYVVTFRETDPLYTIDLSDPADPRVLGELKIMGYSAYLHPMGDDLILGVGQDADEQGRRLGTQLSLFDIADLARPERIAQVTLGEGMSDVEYDHRAFLHWPRTGLTVVPFVRWSFEERTGTEDVQAGAVAFRADRDEGLVRLGVLSHADLWAREHGISSEVAPELRWEWGWRSQIRRTVVVGERLFTVSDAGVGSHDLDSLEDIGFHGFTW